VQKIPSYESATFKMACQYVERQYPIVFSDQWLHKYFSVEILNLKLSPIKFLLLNKTILNIERVLSLTNNVMFLGYSFSFVYLKIQLGTRWRVSVQATRTTRTLPYQKARLLYIKKL